MPRNFKKEAEWDRSVYKRLVFKARIDNGEYDNLKSVLDGRSFADWVRQHLKDDIAGRDCVKSNSIDDTDEMKKIAIDKGLTLIGNKYRQVLIKKEVEALKQ